MQPLAAQPGEMLELQLERAASTDSAYPWHTSFLCLPSSDYLHFSAGPPPSGAEAGSGHGMSRLLVTTTSMPKDRATVLKPAEASNWDGLDGWSEYHTELQVM